MDWWWRYGGGRIVYLLVVGIPWGISLLFPRHERAAVFTILLALSVSAALYVWRRSKRRAS
jgi:hypothetical protein